MEKDVKFAIAKVSTKGQIVIPTELRKNINPGDEFLIVRDEDRIIMKNIKYVANDLKKDLIIAERIEKAWKKYDRGEFVQKTKNDFLKELKKC